MTVDLGALGPWGFEVRRVDKPWGHELIWALSDVYCGKVLFVKAGQSLSLQYHEQKDESWLIQSGLAKIELGAVGEPMVEETIGPGAAFRYRPAHRAPDHRGRGHDDPRGLDAAAGRRRPAPGRLRPRRHLDSLDRGRGAGDRDGRALEDLRRSGRTLDGARPARRARRGVRLPGPERRRQDHDDPAPARPDPADRGARRAARPRLAAEPGGRRRAQVGYLPGDLRLSDRLTGRDAARLARAACAAARRRFATRSASASGSCSTGRSASSRRATGRSSGSCRRSCTARPARPGRADQRPRPAAAGGVPRAAPRDGGRRAHRVPLVALARRGAARGRPRRDHPRRAAARRRSRRRAARARAPARHDRASPAPRTRCAFAAIDGVRMQERTPTAVIGSRRPRARWTPS